MRLKRKLKKNTLKCSDFVTKLKEKDKWLGQYISEEGINESIVETINAKEGKIKVYVLIWPRL